MRFTPGTTYALKNGVKMPCLGLGLYQTPKEETTNIVHNALKLGYRQVDSAQLYGNEREACLGITKFLEESPKVSRSDIFFTTKIKTQDQGYESAKKSIEESLNRVKELDYIDLFLIHAPLTNKEKRLGTWKAFQEYYETGKIKAIGVSNYGIQHLEEMYQWDGLKIDPMVNQYELNPWLTRKELSNYCHQKGMIIQAYSPLTRARRLQDPELVKLVEDSYPEQTSAQILVNWSLQMGFVPLVKTVHEDRLKENIKSCDFELSSADLKKLTHDDQYYLSQPKWDPIKYEG